MPSRAVTTLLFVSCQFSVKFGTCTVVGLNGTLAEAKMFTFTLECTHLSLTRVPFRPTTVQMPKLALVETVYSELNPRVEWAGRRSPRKATSIPVPLSAIYQSNDGAKKKL